MTTTYCQITGSESGGKYWSVTLGARFVSCGNLNKHITFPMPLLESTGFPLRTNVLEFVWLATKLYCTGTNPMSVRLSG